MCFVINQAGLQQRKSSEVVNKVRASQRNYLIVEVQIPIALANTNILPASRGFLLRVL